MNNFLKEITSQINRFDNNKILDLIKFLKKKKK